MVKSVVIGILLLLGAFNYGQELESRRVPSSGLELLHYTSADPWSIFVLKINLQAPGITLKAAKANKNLFSLATTFAIAEFNHSPKEPVLAAINADFFHSSGMPTGGMASDGIVLKPPIHHSVFGLTADEKPFIDIISLNSWLEHDSTHIRIDGYNTPRPEEQTIIYNSFFGRSTRTNSWGNELYFRYLDQPRYLNDTNRVVLQSIQLGEGDAPISSGGFILSSHGIRAQTIAGEVSVSDTLDYITAVSPENRKIAFFVSGLPRIVRDGHVSVEDAEGPNKHVEPRHPRSAVGYDQSGEWIYFVVVDGRQPGYSVGMSLEELAAFLVKIGVYQALNLDGGGSSALIVQHTVVNRPSDSTGERAVCNALLVIRQPE